MFRGTQLDEVKPAAVNDEFCHQILLIIADKRRSLGLYSSLAVYGHGVVVIVVVVVVVNITDKEIKIITFLHSDVASDWAEGIRMFLFSAYHT
jgi:hypothetical protein